MISTCEWDREWFPLQLDPCVATSCQTIPFPPKETGLVHLEDPNNPIMLASEFTLYDASLPLKMKFPGPQFCGDGQILLLVGRVPEDSKAPLEVIFQGEGGREAFHVVVDPGRNFIQRWAVPANITEGLAGQPGDGTTIDLDEPFLLRFSFAQSVPYVRIGCDGDGWMVITNKEPPYPHFFHVFSPSEIKSVSVTGDLEVGYIGFGPKGP